MSRPIRRYWLLFLAVLSGPSAAFGQAVSVVRGTVADAANGSPVAGARIEALLSHAHIESTEAGQFSISILPGDTLRIRALGFRVAQFVAPTGTTALRILLTAAPAVLADMVVTASRREQRSAETAVPVMVISADQIAATAAASADRILGQLPGVQLLPTEPSGADLSIRGINGARVLVLIDGEPTFGNLLENRDLSRLSTIAAERIEVVKGPLSAQYGSDALGGVINLLTARPSGPLSLTAAGRAGDGGRREAQLGAEGGGRFSYRLNGGWREDLAVAGIDQPTDALDRVYDFRSSLGLAVSPGLQLRSDLTLLRERQRWQLSADGFNGFNDNTGASGWVEAAGQVGDGHWSTRLYLEDYTHRFRQAQAGLPIASDTAPTQTEQMAKVSLGYSNRLGLHALSGGVDLSARSIDSPGKVQGSVSDRMAEGYAQDSWTAGPFLLTPAARVTWNSRWGTALTPSVSAAWDLSPTLRWRA
ncbi:MAG: TonB-dependent receptor, partial [Gemmatimonadota bacterium]